MREILKTFLGVAAVVLAAAAFQAQAAAARQGAGPAVFDPRKETPINCNLTHAACGGALGNTCQLDCGFGWECGPGGVCSQGGAD
jgi:hypothetical protein